MSETAMATTGRRQRLPNRRYSETRKLFWKDRTIYLTVGYGPDGLEPKEVFYSEGYKSGSDMATLVSDLCIALSVMLQHEGVTVASLNKSMGETFDVLTGEPMPASILGVLLEELSRPPEWADAITALEGGAGAAAEETGISGEGALDRPGTGREGRPGTPGATKATRHQAEEQGPDGPATRENIG